IIDIDIDIEIPETGPPGPSGPSGHTGHSSKPGYVPAHAELVKVSSYSEAIWYADGDAATPEKPPTTSAGIAILHSVIAYSKNAGLEDLVVETTTIHHGFVGGARLRGEPAVALTADATTLHAAAGAAFPIG